MGLETATFLNDLNTANPAGTDPKSQGDDHLRLIKSTAKNTFPGFAGIVIGTATESGSSNAYALTLSPAPASYTPLLNTLLLFKATHANTGAATLNCNSLGTKPIVDVNGGALASGDIANGSMVAVFYDGTSFCLISANDRAPTDSPTFTGTPAAPTPSAADNSTKVATTAYVDAADALKANLASPALTGTPTAPTPSLSDGSTKIATTAYVDQTAFLTVLPNQSGNSGKFLTTNGTTASWGLNPSMPDIIVQNQQTSGTDGASLSGGSFQTRVLNTVVRNNGSIGSLGSNQVTLPAGTYYYRYRATVSNVGGATNISAASRLYNATDSAAVASSTSASVTVLNTSIGMTMQAEMAAAGVFTIAGSKAFALQTIYGSGSAKEGVAITQGTEIYATLEIWKAG